MWDSFGISGTAHPLSPVQGHGVGDGSRGQVGLGVAPPHTHLETGVCRLSGRPSHVLGWGLGCGQDAAFLPHPLELPDTADNYEVM